MIALTAYEALSAKRPVLRFVVLFGVFMGVSVQRFLRYARLLVILCRQSCYAAFCVQRGQNDKTRKSIRNPAPRRLIPA